VAVDGIEMSPHMVDRMREKPGGDAITVTTGDMSQVRTGRTYGLVYLVYNTIGNPLTQDDQVRCFENAAPPPLSDVLAPSRTDHAMPRTATTASSQEGRLTRRRRGTLYGRTTADVIYNLLVQDPRPWNAAEIISAIERTGALAGLRDPAMAIRAALRRMAERGEVVRVGRGYYQAAGTTPRPVLALELDQGTGTPHSEAATLITDDPKEDEP